jgi:hypothetical protein
VQLAGPASRSHRGDPPDFATAGCGQPYAGVRAAASAVARDGQEVRLATLFGPASEGTLLQTVPDDVPFLPSHADRA